MKPILFCIAAISLYAVQNVTIEARLSKCHPVALSFMFYTTGLVVCLIHAFLIKTAGKELSTPPLSAIIPFVIMAATLAYFGQYFYLSAYNSGGKVMVVTTIALLLPVIASLVKFPTSGELPTLRQVGGYALAVASVVLIAGESSK